MLTSHKLTKTSYLIENDTADYSSCCYILCLTCLENCSGEADNEINIQVYIIYGILLSFYVYGSEMLFCLDDFPNFLFTLLLVDFLL